MLSFELLKFSPIFKAMDVNEDVVCCCLIDDG
jgi:hypothetical protein